MKIGKSDKLFSRFEVNGRRIVMSRNGVNGAARPIKNCSRQDVYEAMADIYNEFYFNEIDTDKMIPIDWIKKYIDSTLDRDNSQMIGFKAAIIEEMVEGWEKENANVR